MNPFKLKNLKEQIANINKLMMEQRNGTPERSTSKQNAGAYFGVPFEDLEKINKDREDTVLAGDIYGELPPERNITPTSQDTWMTFTDPVTGRPTKTDTHIPTPTSSSDPWVTTFVTDEPRPDDIRVDEPTPEEPGVDFPITPVVECERTLPANGIHCQKCVFHLSQGFVPPVVANITGPNCECCEGTGGGDDPVTGDTGFTGVTNTGDTTFTGETIIRCTNQSEMATYDGWGLGGFSNAGEFCSRCSVYPVATTNWAASVGIPFTCDCCEGGAGGDFPTTGDTFTGETFIRCTQIESYANSLGIQSGVPGVDGTTMTAADQFCIKCQSGGYAGDPMCDCCQTDYTYTDDNEIVYEPPITEELCESVFPTTVNINWGGLQISATFPYTTSELINFLVNGTTGTDNNTVYTNVNGIEGTSQLPNLPLGYQAPYDSMDGFLQTLYPNGAGNFQWEGTNLVPTTENAYESINSLIITDPMTGEEFDLFQQGENFNLESWMPNLEEFIGLVNSSGEILSECTPGSPGDIETWQTFNDITGVGEPSDTPDDVPPSMDDPDMETPLTAIPQPPPPVECEEMAESYGGTLESHCIKCQSYTGEIESGSLSMNQLPDFYQEFCFNTNCCQSTGSEEDDDVTYTPDDPCDSIVNFSWQYQNFLDWGTLVSFGVVPPEGFPDGTPPIDESGINLNDLMAYMMGDSSALDGYTQAYTVNPNSIYFDAPGPINGDGTGISQGDMYYPGTENLGGILNAYFPQLFNSLNPDTGEISDDAFDYSSAVPVMIPFNDFGSNLQTMVNDCLNNGGPMNIPPIMGTGVGNITPTIGLGSVLDREDDITTGGEDDRGSVLGGTTDDDRKYGCTDPDALNYDPIANYDDGSCEYAIGEPIPGCTDPTAINYNPNATFDDGSCMTIVMMCEMFNNLGAVAQQIICEGCQPGGMYENNIVCECCESVTPEDPVVRCEIEGDLNGDGEVNAQDAALYAQLATGEIPLEEIPCPTSYCDFSGIGDDVYNGEIVLQYVSNVIDELPPCGGISSSGDDPRGSYEQPMGKDTCCKKCKNGKFSDTCCDKEVGEKRCIYRTITDCQLKRKKSRGKCKPRRTKK